MSEAETSDPSASAVRAQVDRIRNGACFSGSDRLLELLEFVVEETLQGRGAALKESVIGNAVYKREPAYDPRIDSTVRVEARRLRRKLQEYFKVEGRLDPVLIALPTGRYAAVFSKVDAPTERPIPSLERPGANPIFEGGRGAAVAILPFRSISKDPLDDAFADGLTDELQFTMQRARGVRSIAGNMAFQIKDQIYRLATELGVDSLIHGTVRHDGDLIRVTVEMSDPSGFTVWSDRFDGPDRDPLQLQENIAATVLSRVRVDSSLMRTRQIRPGPEALQAMATVMRGRKLLDEQAPAAIHEALRLFGEVAESAPDYARGHSGRADCYCDLFRLGLIDHPTAMTEARAAADRALRIDPDSVEANAAQATISAWLDGDRNASETFFATVRALGGNARASRIYGLFLMMVGRPDEAARQLKDARAMEPYSTQQDVAEAINHYQARRYDEALSLERGARRRVSVEVLVHAALAAVFGGWPEKAASLLDEIEQATMGLPDLVFARAEVEAWLGARGRAADERVRGHGSASCFARATLSAALGDQAGAFAALEDAVQRRELSRAWMRTDPRFDAYRSTSHFATLLDRIGSLRDDTEVTSP